MIKKTLYIRWLVLIVKKNILYSLKDRLIITIGAARIFYGLNAANVKPPKACLDVMDDGDLWGRAGERLCSL